MSTELLLIWLALIPGFVIGYIGHELAHYVVLLPRGRATGLSLWPPRAKFTTPTPIPLDVRLAAVAPVGAAIGLVGVAFLLPVDVGPIGWGIVIGACSRLCYLSPSDRLIAKGKIPS